MHDLPAINKIIAEAKQALKDAGNPQWQDGHPFQKTMENDIKAGYNWVLIDNQKGYLTTNPGTNV